MSVVENNTHPCNLEEEISYQEEQANYYWRKYLEANEESTKMGAKYDHHFKTYLKLTKARPMRSPYA